MSEADGSPHDADEMEAGPGEARQLSYQRAELDTRGQTWVNNGAVGDPFLTAQQVAALNYLLASDALRKSIFSFVICHTGIPVP